MTGKTMAAVAAAIWVTLLTVAGGACDDIGQRRPDRPVCNVVELECEP